MGSLEIIRKLNAYPMWAQLCDPRTAGAPATIAALVELFKQAGREQRREITGDLGRPAKYLMAQYAQAQAVEARRTRSAEAIMAGLVPVVIAGGAPTTATVGSLLAMLLRSAEVAGLDARELFSRAAEFGPDEAAADGIRSFPLLPPQLRDISRFGLRETKTQEGVIYQHQAEAQRRPRWWDRLTGRKPVTREDVLETLRKIESASDLGEGE
jgi:hypothetical protein